MPIYEFYSPGTRKIYSFFARSPSYAEQVPLCPDGERHEMKKLLSGFSITGRNADAPEDAPSEGTSDDPFEGMDPKQAEGVMKELEGAIGACSSFASAPLPRPRGASERQSTAATLLSA